VAKLPDTFGGRLRLLRRKNGLTQSQLASKLELDRTTIYRYENSGILPPMDVMKKICDLFNCSLEFLLAESNNLYDTNVNTVENIDIYDLLAYNENIKYRGNYINDICQEALIDYIDTFFHIYDKFEKFYKTKEIENE